jgi:hypothetical protein
MPESESGAPGGSAGAARIPEEMPRTRAMDAEREAILIQRELLKKLHGPMLKLFRHLSLYWIFGCAILLVFQGFGFWGFSLSDSVLIAAIAAATVMGLALLVVVVKFISSER